MKDGAAALSKFSRPPGRVAVLDLANPFSAALGLEPPSGDAPWLQWKRTVAPNAFWAPETLLGAAEVVMEPKPRAPSDEAPQQPEGDLVVAIYRPYLADQFEPVQETGHWIVHRRRKPLESVGHLACQGPDRRAAGLP
jgi:hypothetical protein